MSPSMAPSPVIPEAKRLERVRERFGIPTLKEFHKRLTEGREYGVSYEAVRNYHYDRKAPADYLGQVAKVFGVRLRWLVLGEGPMTPEDAPTLEKGQQASSTLWDLFERCASPLVREHGAQLIIGAWVHALHQLISSFPEGPDGLTEADYAELGRVLMWMAEDTAFKLGFFSREHTSLVAFQTYFGGYFQTLALAMPDPRQGRSREEFLAQFKKEATDGTP